MPQRNRNNIPDLMRAISVKVSVEYLQLGDDEKEVQRLERFREVMIFDQHDVSLMSYSETFLEANDRADEDDWPEIVIRREIRVCHTSCHASTKVLH